MLNAGDANGQTLSGRFLLRGSADSGPRFLSFTDGKFTDTTIGHVGVRLGTGRYAISKRRIVLEYLEVQDQDTSVYALERYTINSKDGKLTVRLFIEGKAVPGEVQMLNAAGKIIARNRTDDQGFLILNIHHDQAVKAVQIIGAFFYPVKLSKKSLLGWDTRVRVDFRDVEKNYIAAGKDVYTIKKSKKNLLVLQTAEGKEMIFERHPE